jgi:uncharacterized membrane protein (DUF485 family)
MSELTAPPREPAAAPDRDWAAIERTPEFQRLLSSRRRIVVGGTLFYAAYFVGFLLLLGFAEGVLDDMVAGSISVAMLLAASLVLMTFVMAYVYAAKANSEWNSLTEDAALAASRVSEPTTTPPPAHAPVIDKEAIR